MKHTSSVIALIWTALMMNTVYAQKTDQLFNSLEFTYGLSCTSHYFPKTTLILSTYFPETTIPSMGHHGDIAYSRSYKPNSKISLGIGFAQYRFTQKGNYHNDIAGDLLKPYSIRFDFKYVNISYGHRYIYNKGQIFKPYINNNILIEILAQANDILILYEGGISLKTEIGISTKVGVTTYNLGVFYKSGILKYGDVYMTKEIYLPYAYGLELGLSRGF